MASTTCGWCFCRTYMAPVAALNYSDKNSAVTRIQGAYTCINCHNLNLATVFSDYADPRLRVEGIPGADEYPWPSQTVWHPVSNTQHHFPDVPPHIAEAATEATLCLTSGAYRAVGSLARAVLEATAKEKGITTNTLPDKIRALVDAGHLRPHTAEVAHEIREFGNTMAHGDFAKPVTADDAATIIDLMSEVLQEVYQGPARIARVRQAREAKKTTDQTPAT